MDNETTGDVETQEYEVETFEPRQIGSTWTLWRVAGNHNEVVTFTGDPDR